MAYATSADVQARVPSPTLSSSTKPSEALVTQWLVEADAMINGALLVAGLTAPNEDTYGLEILKSKAADYGEGRLRAALASAGNDPNNDSGKDLLERFEEWLAEVRQGEHNQALASGSASSSARVRSYPFNNQDDVDREDDGIVPTFTKAAGENQW